MSTSEPIGAAPATTPDLDKHPADEVSGGDRPAAAGQDADSGAGAGRIPDPSEVFPQLGRPTAFAGYVPSGPGTGTAGYTPGSFGVAAATGPSYAATPAAPGFGSDPKRLLRSRQDRWIGGVCGGIGEYFGWDPNLVRLAFALSILLPGPQLLVYLALWLVIPRAAA
ncbi:PspC domain-containing protein [Gordonia pseudamarae]|jgi:phage shock protein C|uniref:PspC domain-containing protein n=1 Tax=Gordonia pseudamarae TaxID=2831662 RepID=A0ABX6IJM5_9ACTN|nr:PspC domain-containing protein [Gordonia sp. (in: high G+C Gram-positive bacteria)]QHN27023.1 PspC domain-containing protein [Gordonia pseudamarae]QHN35912.1 PspC domain-containing protein [Gordonia pseudamarae]